jgi:hypothetical protein
VANKGGISSENTFVSWAPVAYACNPSYQEAESRRIVVLSQPRQIVHETLSQKKKKITKNG